MHVVTLPTDSAADAAQERLADALRELLDPETAFEGVVEIGSLGLLPANPAGPADPTGTNPPPAPRTTDPGLPVFPVRLYRATVVVGPVHPAAADTPGPCAVCLERRWIRLRPLREREALETGTAQHAAGPGPAAPHHWSAPTVAAALHTLAARTVRTDATGLAAAPVLEVSTTDGTVTEHALLADPDCPRCGTRAPAPAPSLEGFPASRPRPHPDAPRLRDWHSYDLPRNALVNPLCGALGSRTHHDTHSPVTESVSGSLRLGGHRTGRSGLYEIAWAGHTDTHERSETVALFEGLERYAGQRPWGRGPATRMSLDELTARGLPALDPRPVLHAPEFYARHPDTHKPFRPDERVDWVWGHSLVRDAPVLVPQHLVHYGPRRRGESLLSSNSNGCATGSCLEEAALFGLLELIERDAFLLSWYGAERLPEIDLDSATATPRRAALRARLEGLGYRVRLFDLRVDLPVPAVLCLVRRRTPGPGNIVLSAGAALTAGDAVDSALQEVASLLPHHLRSIAAREEEARAMVTDYGLVRDLDDHDLLYGLPEMERHVPFLRPYEDGPVRPVPLREAFADWEARGPRPADLLDDLTACVDLLREVSEDVIVVDQTCPEQRACGLRSAAVVAPGLVPIDFGWEEQRALHHPRLRTASWRAGRRPAPLRDEDIHRHPHPFA
ncbi:TOMM precursor leader peptide-binding protein [Streptomyces sp. NPDC054865]